MDPVAETSGPYMTRSPVANDSQRFGPQTSILNSGYDENSFASGPMFLSKSTMYRDPLGSVPLEIAVKIAESFAPIEIIRFEQVSKTWASILRSDHICYNAFFRHKGPLKYMSDLERFSGEVNPWNRRLKSLIRKENAWLKKGPEMTFSLTMVSENWLSMFTDNESDGRKGVGTLYQDERIIGQTKDGVSIFSLLDFTYRTILIPEVENF